MLTEFELLTLHKEYFEASQSQYTNLISVLFAFLIASYLVASKLKVSMVVVVLVLFTAYWFDSALGIFYYSLDMYRVQQALGVRLAEGSTDLMVHAGARGSNQIFIVPWGFSRVLGVIGGYIGALIFFFHQRYIGQRE